MTNLFLHGPRLIKRQWLITGGQFPTNNPSAVRTQWKPKQRKPVVIVVQYLVVVLVQTGVGHGPTQWSTTATVDIKA